MKGVSTNVIAIILLAIGLAVIVLFLVFYGSQTQNRTFNILAMLNALKNIGGWMELSMNKIVILILMIVITALIIILFIFSNPFAKSMITHMVNVSNQTAGKLWNHKYLLD